jgi:hypothetical protein
MHFGLVNIGPAGSLLFDRIAAICGDEVNRLAGNPVIGTFATWFNANGYGGNWLPHILLRDFGIGSVYAFNLIQSALSYVWQSRKH